MMNELVIFVFILPVGTVVTLSACYLVVALVQAIREHRRHTKALQGLHPDHGDG